LRRASLTMRAWLLAGATAAVFGICLTAETAAAQAGAPPANPHYLRGLEYERQRNLEAAAVEYRAAIAGAPGLAEAHDRLGFVLGLQGHTAEAIAEFEQAIALQPSSFDARYHPRATLDRKSP